MLRLGIPSAGENVSYNLSQLMITAFVNTMGIVAINTRIYANMLMTFTYMIAFSASVMSVSGLDTGSVHGGVYLIIVTGRRICGTAVVADGSAGGGGADTFI